MYVVGLRAQSGVRGDRDQLALQSLRIQFRGDGLIHEEHGFEILREQRVPIITGNPGRWSPSRWRPSPCRFPLSVRLYVAGFFPLGSRPVNRSWYENRLDTT